MSMQELLRKLRALSNSLQPLALLVVRVFVGVGFFYAGKGKLEDLGRTSAFFADLGLPLPGVQAAFIGGLEAAGGIALVLGLGTRIFAALLSCTMIVALLLTHEGTLMEALSDFTALAPLPFLLPLLVLLTHGASTWSLDWILFGKRFGDKGA